MVVGYAYPAYECFKIVEKDKPEIEQLVSWSQYWILLAMLTVFERIGDVFFSWLPLYSEAKLALILYLWSNQMKGTKYLYTCFFQPFMTQHEVEIDRNILELRTKAGNFAILYWKKALSIGQTRFLEILQSVSSHDELESQPQGKLLMVSGHNEDCTESTVNTELKAIAEEPKSSLGNGDKKFSQQKTFDKETTPSMRGKWRKMFASEANSS
ncbi:TB2/DP1/HVA22-related protein [Parasponia andersonii]|uniref:HVA22-like protein n=1 Tax=Parasponia andersonii TaxID=3476 RepID=A0A2P5C227_PARAD|nr:TB2/DP1/HVA22-related protein [Parasponia andersonii]